MLRLALLAPLFAERFPWVRWEAALRAGRVVLDRPKNSAHPHYPDIRYPIDYGYLDGSSSGDGDAVDVFVGTARTGLVGAVLTHDKRKGDREVKLLVDCTPAEVYCALGFLNYAPGLLVGHVAMRYAMREVWARAEASGPLG